MNTPDEKLLLGRIASDLIRIKRRNLAITVLAVALAAALILAVVT